MSAATDTLPAGQHRFLCDSATAAADIIRERLGELASVISVRQVPRKGWFGFVRSPQLEVIAAAAEPPTAPPPPSATVAGPAQEPSPVPAPPVAPPAPPFTPASPPRVAVQSFSEGAPLWDALLRAGLRRTWLAQLREADEWQALELLPLSASLPRAASLLLRHVPVATLPLGPRCAFFGSAGAGVTTALGKQLTRDPLVRQGAVAVMKAENQRANCGEGLAALCEALRIPFVRSLPALQELHGMRRVYFDSPSLPMDTGGARRMQSWLESNRIQSRVVVLNAAYETALLQEQYAWAESAGATHVVLTHLDELPRWGKLWEFLLRGRLAPLFGSVGGSMSGQCEPELLARLVRRTLSVAERTSA